MSATPHVAGRSCADCTLCCKLLTIVALDKPSQQWCQHCTIGKGCKIYATKPDECTAFQCQYLINADLGEEWRPARSKMVLHFEPHSNRVVVHVDSSRPDAWKREPYYAQIRRWSHTLAPAMGQVIVWQNADAIIVLPHAEKNLGPVRDDQLIVMTQVPAPGGFLLDAVVMERDDPRLAGKHVPTRANPQGTFSRD